MSKKKKDAPQKPKEQKIIYIDDGSTVADMSGTFKGGKEPPPKTTFKEKFKTYFSVVKKMVLPLIITLLVFSLLYMLLLTITGKW